MASLYPFENYLNTGSAIAWGIGFLLMMPLIMAMFFFIIEMSLYFTTVHYTSYATYAAARAHLQRERAEAEMRALLAGG